MLPSVLVASKNVDKVTAVRDAFEVHMRTPCDVTGVECDSGIWHGQPWGMQHMYEGANARLECFDLSSPDTPEYIVSIESGIETVNNHSETMAFDMACVIVLDTCNGLREVAYSQTRYFPLETVRQAMRSGTTRGEIGARTADYYHELALPCSRYEQIQQATRMALSKLHNSDPFF